MFILRTYSNGFMMTVPDTKSYIVNQLIAIGNKNVKYFISNLPAGLA